MRMQTKLLYSQVLSLFMNLIANGNWKQKKLSTKTWLKERGKKAAANCKENYTNVRKARAQGETKPRRSEQCELMARARENTARGDVRGCANTRWNPSALRRVVKTSSLRKLFVLPPVSCKFQNLHCHGSHSGNIYLFFVFFALLFV